MSALEDGAQDFRRGVAAVCGRGGEVVIGGAEAGGAEGGVAVLLPLFRVVWVRWVVFIRRGSPEACGPPSCDVGAGVVCQGLAPLNGGDPDVLALGVLAGGPSRGPGQRWPRGAHPPGWPGPGGLRR